MYTRPLAGTLSPSPPTRLLALTWFACKKGRVPVSSMLRPAPADSDLHSRCRYLCVDLEPWERGTDAACRADLGALPLLASYNVELSEDTGSIPAVCCFLCLGTVCVGANVCLTEIGGEQGSVPCPAFLQRVGEQRTCRMTAHVESNSTAFRNSQGCARTSSSVGDMMDKRDGSTKRKKG